MSDRPSEFEKLIGDVNAFRLMLEGAFKEWEGTYDVLLSDGVLKLDTAQYLFGAMQDKRFRPFCRRLRTNPEGDRRCLRCDISYARKASKDGQPMIYLCHAGLRDVAVPIEVGGQYVATVFCGQVRPEEEDEQLEGLERAIKIETELGFGSGELVDLWEQAPSISKTKFNDTIRRVSVLVDYISKLGHQALELQKAHQKDRYRLQLSDALEDAAKVLTELVDDYETLWTNTGIVLSRMLRVIGATCAMALVRNTTADVNANLQVKAVADLDQTVFRNRLYSLTDDILGPVVDEGEILIVPFRKHLASVSTICGSINQFAPEVAAKLDKAVLIRIRLGSDAMGVLIFFINAELDTSNGLSVEEEKGTLVNLASLIGTAYHNCTLYQAQQREFTTRRKFLRHVTHQLIAPLHGIQGYAEDAAGRLQRWQKKGLLEEAWTEDEVQKWRDDLHRLEHSYSSAVWTAHYAARLASNLAWVVYRRGQDDTESPRIDLIEDVGGLLIAYARDFQGLARERGFRRVEVNSQAVNTLNRKICVDRDLFRQAVGNLLDNAIKYGDMGTDILIEGELFNDKAEIRIANYGICLRPDEVNRIFEEEYRTRGAKRRNPSGSGIGLTVAREIIKLLRGELTVLPSTEVPEGWRTTFIIRLPLVSISSK